MVCYHKSVDPYAPLRLSKFIKESGCQHLVYKSDQESSMITVLEDALKLASTTGELCDPDGPMALQAIPEHSAAGASPSNGRAGCAAKPLRTC